MHNAVLLLHVVGIMSSLPSNTVATCVSGDAQCANIGNGTFASSSEISVPPSWDSHVSLLQGRSRYVQKDPAIKSTKFATNEAFHFASLQKGSCVDNEAMAEAILNQQSMTGGCPMLSSFCQYFPKEQNPCPVMCGLCPVDLDSLETVTIDITTANPPFKVKGFIEGEVARFEGIPFSKSRAPPNRFEPPEEYVHEEGSTFNALSPGGRCVQSSGQGDEDCLNLDIYAPHNHNKISPVLVWIHGGSWMTGSKNDYVGKLWASESWHNDVDRFIVTILNYRMNILGFPDLPSTGVNLAILDVIMALKWVNNHISNFGGNTDSITIFGESAGSMNVLDLWVSPQARGLFHRAIAQSPYIWDYDQGTSNPSSTRENKKKRQTACMNKAMELACGDSAGSSACTFQTPTLDHLKQARCFGSWYGPQSDGSSILHSTFYEDICTNSVSVGAGVPLLVGHNALEVALWVTMGTYASKQNQMVRWVEKLTSSSPEEAECLLSQLGKMYEATGKMKAGKSHIADHHYATSGIFFNMLTEVLSRNPDVYQYSFNESIPGSYGGMCEDGAHACEVAFVIGEEAGLHSSVEEDLQTRMRHVWAQFASKGEPGWSTTAIGKFSEGQLEIDESGAPFDPSISDLLHNIMCDPEKVKQDSSCH